MRAIAFAAVVGLAAAPVWATEHESWAAYAKANRFTCPGPLDTLKQPRTITLAGKTYRHTGFRLEVQSPDADKVVKIGLLSAVKDVSAGTKQNLQEAFAWFKQEQVEWVVANGDLALEEFDLEEVLDTLAEPGLPVLVVLGNSESKGSFARAYKDRMSKYPNLLNGVWLRQIVADDVELWTLSGYHDRRFVHQGASCSYGKEHIDALGSMQPAGGAPVVLVAHGPPLGKGQRALDWILDKKNVGDSMLTELIASKGIPFGLFGHILEAGGAAVGKDLATHVPVGKAATHLYVNAGSISGDPWGMNDGSAGTGMAFIITVDDGKASYAVKRFKPTANDDE